MYATKSTASSEAVSCLSRYFNDYSKPNTIISDRGTAFTSGEFTEFLSDNYVKHTLIPTGSPQANGQVEPINRVMVPILAKLKDDKTGKL